MDTINDVTDEAAVADLFEGLVGVLRKEIEVYGELLSAVRQERAILIRPAVDKIQESNARKETCVLKAKMLEEVRLKGLRKIAGALGIDPAGINISLLLNYAGYRHRDELRDCQLMLRPLLEEVRKANEANRLFLESSIGSVEGSIRFIQSILYPGTTYLDSGEMKRQAGSGSFLRTEG
ncbi:MAG: flagellar protein FlgN [Syntrophales bacterium]|nr:flagellar protein FlgN [Syntrophales bacterium]MDD5231845.1 flagellar protein FlgN [Syntrophales bacterium]MDD5531351.1 flagellar protein FlgN [Syntrophales bacterium]